MQEDLVGIFCTEYTKHINILHQQNNAIQERHRKELNSLEKERKNLIQAIKDGVAAALVKDDLERVMARKEEVEQALSKPSEIKSLIHPAMASRFHQAVKDLRNGLNTEGSRSEASEHLRALVDKIVLTPNGGEKGLSIDLYGDLAGILNMAMEKKDMTELNMIKRLQLLTANDNSPETLQDGVGSGGRI